MHSPIISNSSAILALEDGAFFVGEAFGHRGTQSGEAVFNTALSGYQEVLTDPSYCGQIVTMTSPHIGNYGVNDEDLESAVPHVAGFVVRERASIASNQRASESLDSYLERHRVVGISGVDTRALTRRLRTRGAMRAVITSEVKDPGECVRLARESPSMVGLDLVTQVAPKQSTEWNAGLDATFTPSRRAAVGARHVVAIDCGMKRNILRHLVDAGCRVTVVPPILPAGDMLDLRPDGLFISNGPGDPAAVTHVIETVRSLLGRLPIFGICLGHQLLGLALGAETFKLKFGHRGVNHPVKHVETGRVEITSQNHGFAVDKASLERRGGVTTHVNLNDGTLEGFVHTDKPILAIQYHPEAAPGPHDATYLFDCFLTMMATGRCVTRTDVAAAQAALASRRAAISA